MNESKRGRIILTHLKREYCWFITTYCTPLEPLKDHISNTASTAFPAALSVYVEVYQFGDIYGETIDFGAGQGDLGAFFDAMHRVSLKGVEACRKW